MRKQKDGFTGERSLVLPESRIRELRKNPWFEALYLTDIGHYPCAQNHYRQRDEPIGEHILIYCMEGSGYFSICDKEYRVTGNQFFILPPGVPHRYGADSGNPWTIYWLHFGGTMAPFYSSGLYEPQELAPQANARLGERIALFETIYRTLEWGYSNENLLYATSVLHHLLASFRFVHQFRDRRDQSARTDIVDTALLFMQENIEKKLSVSELASYVGYSVSHLTALFQARTGLTPIAAFNRLRIRQACLLLDSTDMKINRICHKVGISDCFYFSRLFRKETGMSPTAYRNRGQGGIRPLPPKFDKPQLL